MTLKQKERIEKFIQAEAIRFHKRRISRLDTLDGQTIVQRIDPFILILSDVTTCLKWATHHLDRFMFASEETLKGNMYENIAYHIAKILYGATRSDCHFDFLLDSEEEVYLIEIKSGPHWGNSSQRNALIARFEKDIEKIKTSKRIIPLLGVCYGNSHNKAKADSKIKELRGQEFWQFLTGDLDFYKVLAKNFAIVSKKYMDRYRVKRNQTINRLANDFNKYCFSNGEINKDLVLEHNSAKTS